jgi:uncharacterized protein (DUF111 family)
MTAASSCAISVTLWFSGTFRSTPSEQVTETSLEVVPGAVRDTMLRETGTLGVRAAAVARWPQIREERTVDVDDHTIRVKVAVMRWGGGGIGRGVAR